MATRKLSQAKKSQSRSRKPTKADMANEIRAFNTIVRRFQRSNEQTKKIEAELYRQRKENEAAQRRIQALLEKQSEDDADGWVMMALITFQTTCIPMALRKAKSHGAFVGERERSAGRRVHAYLETWLNWLNQPKQTRNGAQLAFSLLCPWSRQ